MLKHNTRNEKREKIKPLGTHTAIGHLHELKKWKEVPYLRENNGMLPPFMICVGSRVRVMKAKDILKLREHIFIDNFALDKFGPSAYGRVNILLGIAESNGVEFPLSVVETQMGCPATQINMHELLYFSNPSGYIYDNKLLKGDESLYVIRAGTCAGVNGSKESAYMYSKIGDIAIATRTIGSIGSVIQSYLHMLSFIDESVVNARSGLLSSWEARKKYFYWNKPLLTQDKKYFITLSSERLVGELLSVAKKHSISFVKGTNFTKDSLYAEMSEDDFIRLHNTYGVVSTEMEQLIIEFIANEFTKNDIKTNTALISAVIGAIPGKSFPTTKNEKMAADEAERNTLLLSKEAFASIILSFDKDD